MTPRACAALTLFVATVAHTQRATALSLHIPARAVAVGGERAAAPAAAAAVCGKRQSSSSSTELRCAGGEGSSSNRSNTRRSVWARGPGWAPSSRRSGAPKRPPSLRDGPESGTAAGGAGGGTRLGMVASNPLDVQGSRGAGRQRPLLPAERGINASMEGFNAGVVNLLKGLMVTYYGERTYARFYALETIARVPYFGYLCVLHLYETLGQWRQAEYLKVHFAESYNELHHLLIMEELGGNRLFWDRWFAQHAAFFYFFVVILLYLSNPRNAYNLNQHVEEHAFTTYDAFLADHEMALKEQPAPAIAKKYYGTDKLYAFNGLHNGPNEPTFEERDQDRPVISNLFDTFVAVRNDEWEHVKTMKAMQEDVAKER